MKSLQSSSRWRGGVILFSTVITAVGAYALNGSEAVTDEELEAIAEKAAFSPMPPVGGSTTFPASPDSTIEFGALQPKYSHVDLTLRGPLGRLNLTRSASGPSGAWQVAQPARKLGSPFGFIESPAPTPRMQWWHSLHSYILERTETRLGPACTPESPGVDCQTKHWDVFGGGAGVMTSFFACEETNCFGFNSSEQALKVQKVGEQLIVHAATGRYYYEPADRRDINVGWATSFLTRFWERAWYLSYIESPQYDAAACPEQGKEDAGNDVVGSCHRRVARLYYETPDECGGNEGELADVTVGADFPMLRTAVAGSGSQLVFRYQSLPSRASAVLGGKSHECVLESIDVVGRDGLVEAAAVTYQYLEGKAGILTEARWPDQPGNTVTGTVLEYAYQLDGGSLPAPAHSVWEVKRNGVSVVRQYLSDAGHVLRDTHAYVYSGSDLKSTHFVGAENNGCRPGTFSNDSNSSCRTQAQFVRTDSPLLGDGTGTGVEHVYRWHKMAVAGEKPRGDQGPRLFHSFASVDCGTQCLAIEPPLVPSNENRWTWGWIDATWHGGAVDVPRTAQGANGAYSVYETALAWPSNADAGAYLPPAELRRAYLGAVAPDGGVPLLTQEYTYTYGGAQQTAARRAFEQLIETEASTSAFAEESPNLKAITRRNYDPKTNRLRSVIRSGQTLKFDSASNTWGQEDRHIGIFYHTFNVCSETTEDAKGRVRSIVGPCNVGSDSAILCSANDSTAIVAYDYWPESETGNRAGHLKAKKVYPNGCNSTPIVTLFEDYDARGRLLSSTDSNGVGTSFVYEGSQLVKKVEAVGTSLERVSEFGYDDGATHGDYIKSMNGRYEVLCFRRNTVPGQGCVGGERTHLLQWKAFSSVPSGASHSERVDYTYHEGKLRSEIYRDAANQVRRTRYFEGDPLGRQTFESWGAASPASPSENIFSQVSLYDKANNRIGLGSPYQSSSSAPEPLCGGFDPGSAGLGEHRMPASPQCKAFLYDRLNRLIGFVEPPQSGINNSPATKACFSYSKAGHLRSVRWGCPGASGSAEDCSQCTQPSIEYRHDDFGNIVSITTPWSQGAYRFEYDAAGNRVRKQTPSMASLAGHQWVENSYDGIGRVLKSEAVRSPPVPVGEEARKTLYWYSYDQQITPPTGCPGHAANLPSLAMGRPQVLTDSFGDTWYRYDAQGNVIGQYRVRTQSAFSPRTAPCFFPGGHHRYYDAPGRLLSETYPGGRSVVYGYYPAPNSHRIQSISTTTLASTGLWGGMQLLVENVQWEPFAGLRSYELIAPNAPASAQKAKVEYHWTGSNQPLSTCSSTSFATGSDSTGRMFGLTVSKSEAGGALGDIFKRVYTWRADQLLQEDTCLLETGAVPPSSIRYAESSSGVAGYDSRLQLRHARKLSNASVGAGGSFSSRYYEYDTRGNRTFDAHDNWSFEFEYSGNGTSADRLMTRTRSVPVCSSPPCTRPISVTQRYQYDADGRATRLAGHKRYSDAPSSPINFLDLDPSMDGKNAAIGAVYREVEDSDERRYEYFYDAAGRRRLKRYMGASKEVFLDDEFFYDGVNLLEDRGHTSLNPATADSVYDEYIWLAGRPVAFFKRRVNRAGPPVADFVGECPRNGEPAPCGLYYIVTDSIGKPVLTMDANRRVSGVADYDPFGHINRTTLVADTPLGVAPQQTALMATLQAPTSAATTTQVRLRASFVDFQNTDTRVYLANAAGTSLTGVNGSPSMIYHNQGFLATTPWTDVDADGSLQVMYRASKTTAQNDDEASLSGFEYRRFQVGASPVWTPLRFPGQYHDAETDLFENWNRFYDPQIGRYLGADSMLSSPAYLLEAANAGMSVPVYAYAHNNPVVHTDPTGEALPLLLGLACVGGACEVAIAGAAVAATATAAYVAAKVVAHFNEKQDSPATAERPAKPTKLPPMPEGMGVTEFGEALGWPENQVGKPPVEVTTPTAERLDEIGVTEEMAEAWRDFYEQVDKHNPKTDVKPGNPSAGPRRDFFDKILEVLRGSPD
ncbi:RHS repeat-associated core domain-containing protein [Myxococcus xanthus]|uniref:RHS repeat-associated core domain-containing protein n=1 Tax=Myxococcus xanthus TaxID=34 RepID=UPI001376105F|nr:RHS repeat-associated core domain-containing protein [Myxococcus xanthus]